MPSPKHLLHTSHPAGRAKSLAHVLITALHQYRQRGQGQQLPHTCPRARGYPALQDSHLPLRIPASAFFLSSAVTSASRIRIGGRRRSERKRRPGRPPEEEKEEAPHNRVSGTLWTGRTCRPSCPTPVPFPEGRAAPRVLLSHCFLGSPFGKRGACWDTLRA